MKDQLKFITCGSVDDGKSTLIGHMLYEAKLLFTDQEHSLEIDSKSGSREGEIDYSLLLDGLMAEREQGITIDVAYRFFTTERRSFIVADCPGHEQYTRNMAVGASFADLAVILVDAASGVSIQTKRHLRICALMGINHVVLAVNKMDLIGYDKMYFDEVKRDFKRYASEFELKSIQVIPISATSGDNVVNLSDKTPWYNGLPLLSYLEEIDTDAGVGNGFSMPVQRVCRPNQSFRGFQGQIESGKISVGDEIVTLPGYEKAGVAKILATDIEVDSASSGQAVTLQLNREVDVSRGSVLVRGSKPEYSSMFRARLLWMDEQALVPGRGYLLKCGTKTLPASVMQIKNKIEIETGKEVPASKLYKNELANCDISLSEHMAFDSFEKNRSLGSFILIDRITNMTSACGTITYSLRRDSNIVWQNTDITPEIRAGQKNQKAMTLWFTGLSGSGKSALSNELEKHLVSTGKHTMILDGDNIRHGLNRDLGFTEGDRVENIRRIAEVSKLLNDAGLIVLTAFISPYRADREAAAEIIGDNFFEIYVSTPIEECERRDVKGLYKKARLGQIPEFTGVSSPYEPPVNPDVVIDTTDCSIEEAADYVWKKISSAHGI